MKRGVRLKHLDSGDYQVVLDDRPLYADDPKRSAEARLGRVPLQPDTLILWSSPLLWYGLEKLLDRLPDGCHVAAVEYDQRLHELALAKMHTGDTRVSFSDGSPDSVANLLSMVSNSRLRRVIEVTTSGSAMLHRSRYREIKQILERQIQIVWQNRRTLQAMGRLWVRNLQRNLIDLPESLPLHRNASNAAIVCGAGPSLERIVPLLRKTREKVLLVSVDTALPILEMHGFTPDIVVALEGQLYNAYDFLPVSDRTGYTFVADLSSNPVAAELHQGTSWVLSMFDELPLLRRVARLRGIRSILPPLGSVGVAALALAQTVTNGPILMSGLDFAVTAGNTHARGAPAQTTGLASATRAAPVRDRGVEVSLHVGPGYGNGAVLTTPILKGYARDVENVAVPHRCHVVEPMGLSTRVPAIGVRPASELIEEACKLPSPPQGLNPDHPAHNGDDRFRDVYSFIHNEIQLLDRLLSARDDTERQERFSLCDYVACDLQGGRESIHNDPFWQRVRINAEYFRSRWKLTQELMNQRR